MECTYCGTVLPSGALFCGECGRTVAAAPQLSAPAAAPTPKPQKAGPAAPPRKWVEDTPAPVSQPRPTGPGSRADPSASAVLAENTVPMVRSSRPQHTVPGAQTRCDQCDSVMAREDIFCGECGFVSRAITSAFTGAVFSGGTEQPRPQADANAEVGPAPDAAPVVRPKSVTNRTRSRSPQLPLPPMPGPPPLPASQAPTRRFSAPSDADASGVYFLDGDDDDDIEATRIVRRKTGNRFILQFSTGESFTVYGTGLIGRNPQPEPGEYFDQLIRVLDSGKSVSKTHLEFGQESGTFWVKDRFSGNGSVVREPDAAGRRCEPGLRYKVIRGARIDIGEQFFIVS
jgi:hypothetical protein